MSIEKLHSVKRALEGYCAWFDSTVGNLRLRDQQTKTAGAVVKVRAPFNTREGRLPGMTLRRPRRWLLLWRVGSPLRLGASHQVPSLIDFLVGRTVRTLCGGCVLRGGAIRSGSRVLLCVAVAGMDSPPATTLAQPELDGVSV